MTMVTDDDDQRGEGSLGEKRSFDLLARLLHAYGDEETRAIQGKEEQEINMVMINTSISEGTKALLGIRKIEEYESQLNPKRHDAFSPSLSPVEFKRRHVVSNEPIRAEPIREIKPPVRRKPVRRECGVTPKWLVDLMRKENGVDAKLITVKDLKASDLKEDQARLLLPFNQITEINFLNEAELNIIEEHRKNIAKKGVDVILVDSRGKQWKLNLRRWDMNTSSNYVLVSGWKEVFLCNNLNVGQSIHLWSFHSHDRLYFALAPPPPTQAMTQVPDAVPAPGPAMASDPDMALAPAMAQAQAPVPATGSSSTPAPVVTRDSDGFGQSMLQGLDLNRTLAQVCTDMAPREAV